MKMVITCMVKILNDNMIIKYSKIISIYMRLMGNYPTFSYSSSVGEIRLIKENFYKSGDNGVFQALTCQDVKFNLY